MLTVCGKIQSARKSASGKSVAVNVGGTWIHVNAEDVGTFKDAVGKGEPIEVRARPDLLKDENGAPKLRSFKRRDGTPDTSEDIRVRYWYVKPGADTGLGDLIGAEATNAGTDVE